MPVDTPPPAGAADLARALARSMTLLAPERRTAWMMALAGTAVAGLHVIEPILFGLAINALAANGSPLRYVMTWGIVSFAVFLCGLAISVVADRMAHRRRLAAMSSYLEHVLALPVSFHSRAQSGRLMRIMLSGCDTLFMVWLPVLREQLTNIVTILLVVPIAFYINWRLAILLGILMFTYLSVNILVVRYSSTGQSEVEQQFVNISGRVSDLVGNVTVLQSFLAVALEMRAVKTSLEHLLAAQYPILNWWAAMSVLTRGASSISIVAIFAYGAALAETGKSTIGDIVSFVGFTTLLIGRLDQTTSFVMGAFLRAPALVQFFQVLDERPEIVERPGAPPLEIHEARVSFDHVTFRYPRGSGGIFDFSLEAEPGQTIAIVGSTGSGKSTALALLTRAYDAEVGRIVIDGQDIRDVTIASLRESIAVVFQDAGLFSRSIAENIAIGRPGAPMEDIEAAAKTAGAYDFIQRKEHGFHTVLGERGQGLSGGERQRIAIARALLKNAPILILDEATSALDIATETRLQSALERLRAGRTTFVIAHRLSTVRGADKIVFLDAGRIAETGNFDELLRRNGLFAGFVRAGEIPHQREDTAA